jgi:hypothetical protein
MKNLQLIAVGFKLAKFLVDARGNCGSGHFDGKRKVE